MKKRILSLALVSTMALGMLYSAPTEAGRISKSSFRKFRRPTVTTAPVVPVAPVAPAPPVEEQPVVETPSSPDEPQLGSAIEIAGNAVNVKDFGAVADANYYNPSNGNYYSDASFKTPATDATDAINKAIKHASQNGIAEVHIPEGNYLIRSEGSNTAYVFEYATKGGIQLENNITLRMTNGTTLMTNTVYKGGYSLVTVNNKENVKIIGGKIVGDMDTHPANNHNYCYGITIANGSKNVVVDGVETTKAEDDGIMIVDYFANLSGGRRSSDIEIRNVKSHNNGRQGLTISTGSNIKVVNSEFSNQTKHSPMSGIDIELESYDHIGVENVEITGNTFNGNAYSGVVFSDMFNDQPGSLSKNININSNKVNGSRFGVIASGKVDGLNISNNDISIDHMTSEFSAGLGSTSGDSKNVSIEGNRVISKNGSNHSIGAIVLTSAATVRGNTLQGQRKGVVVYADNTTVSNNVLSSVIELPFEVIGQNNNVANNQVN